MTTPRAEARERVEQFLAEHNEEQVRKILWQWTVDDGDEPDPDFQSQAAQLRASFARFSREHTLPALQKALDEVYGPEPSAPLTSDRFLQLIPTDRKAGVS